MDSGATIDVDQALATEGIMVLAGDEHLQKVNAIIVARKDTGKRTLISANQMKGQTEQIMVSEILPFEPRSSNCHPARGGS